MTRGAHEPARQAGPARSGDDGERIFDDPLPAVSQARRAQELRCDDLGTRRVVEEARDRRMRESAQICALGERVIAEFIEVGLVGLVRNGGAA